MYAERAVYAHLICRYEVMCEGGICRVRVIGLGVGSCDRRESSSLLWLKLILKFVSVSLDFSLSFHHGEGDEEGRGGGAADEEGHAPCDEGDEGR